MLLLRSIEKVVERERVNALLILFSYFLPRLNDYAIAFTIDFLTYKNLDGEGRGQATCLFPSFKIYFYYIYFFIKYSLNPRNLFFSTHIELMQLIASFNPVYSNLLPLLFMLFFPLILPSLNLSFPHFYLNLILYFSRILFNLSSASTVHERTKVESRNS